MKGLIRSQVHDAGVLSPKSVMLLSERGRKRTSMKYNWFAYQFCRRLLHCAIGRESEYDLIYEWLEWGDGHTRVDKQCPYLLNFIDIVLDVEVTTDWPNNKVTNS